MDVVYPFYDYSIHEKCISNGNYEKTVSKLYELGYRTIAINQVIDVTSGGEPKKKKKKGASRDDVVPAPLELPQVKGCEDMKIFNRLTVIFASGDAMYKTAKSHNSKKYHILALQPTTQAAFQFACSNLDADILTFNPDEKQVYKCGRKLYNLLVNKGYHFEIMYSPAIASQSSRRNVIHVSHLYHTFGKSKNVIISSGAESPFLVRSPYDVINLGLIFGLNEQQSKNAISHCCKSVYLNSVGRRHGKTVMLVEKITDDADVPEEECEEDEDMEEIPPAQKKMKSVC